MLAPGEKVFLWHLSPKSCSSLEIDNSSSQLVSVSTWELNKFWSDSFSYDILKGVAALQWSCDLVTAVYCLAFCFSDTFPMVSEMSKISKGEWLDWKPGGDWCVKLKPAVGSMQHSWKKSRKYNRQKLYKSTIFVSTARKLADQSWKIARILSADFPNCLVQQEWRGCWAAREGTGAKSSVSQQLPKLPSCVHCALSTLLSCVNIEHIEMHREASCADNKEKWTLASAHRGKDCQKRISDSGANFSISESGNCPNCV